ncbi:HD domain-containing protein, partial [bacterium]|nr:HD domain-containing protein [bacterium]
SDNQPLAFRIREMMTAYRLYVNNKLVSKNGTVGKTRETMIPEYSPHVSEFMANENKFDIIIQVSNFHHRKAGIWEIIKLGQEKDIREQRERGLAIDIFLIASILIMALYHLVLFSLRRSDQSALFFSIFCFLVAIRSAVTGSRYLIHLFPDLGWEMYMKIEYLSFYMAVPTFAIYMYRLFPQEFSKKVIWGILVTGSVFSGLVVIANAKFFTHTVQPYQIFTLIAGVYQIYVFLMAYKGKQQGSLIFLAGFSFLFLIVINEILHTNEIINTGYFLSLGLFVFIFSQAVLISMRFVKAFYSVEESTEALIETNVDLRKEVIERTKLERSLTESHQNFQDSRIGIILGLAKLAEYRDEDTGAHLERMREYSRILAGRLAVTPKYLDYITDEYIDDMFHSAILHDIGKVGIQDSILLKPGKLDSDEFETMKHHATIGGDAIMSVEAKINVQSFLTLGRDIAYNHHEKWDGSGYPKGLKSEDIPLSARIVALADVYDALTSERPYKKAFTHQKATDIILDSKGTHFDPDIVEAFKATENEFDNVRRRLQDK